MSNSQPIVYDTTNANQTNLMQMAQLVAQNMNTGAGYSITGPNASYVQNYANTLSGVKADPNASPSSGTDWLSLIGQGMASTSAGGAAQAAASGGSTPGALAAGGAANKPDANLGPTSNLSFTEWLQVHASNYGLVIMGALLILGALLISQKDNIQTVVKTAGVLAA